MQYLYDRQLEKAYTELQNLAYVIAHDVDGAFAAADLSVSKVVQNLKSYHPANLEELNTLATQKPVLALLEGVSLEDPFIANMAIIGADGSADAHSRTGLLPADVLANTRYMHDVEEAGDAFQLSNPFFNASSQSWMIALSKGITAPDGTFLGAVAGIVKLSEFYKLLDRINMGEHGSISIFSREGALLTWTPKLEIPFGTHVSGAGIYDKFIAPHKEGVAQLKTPEDKIPRVYAVANASNYPLSIVTTRGMPDIITNWIAATRFLVLVGGLALIVVATVTIKLARMIDGATRERERRVLEKHMAEQALTLANAINNVSHGVAMFDKNGHLQVWNTRYAEMFGFPSGFLRAGLTRDDLLDYRGANGYGRSVDDSIPQPDGSFLSHAKMADGRVIAQRKKMLVEGGWVSTHEDITERLAAQEHIHQMATRDALTGLLNRFAFKELLEKSLVGARRGEAQYAIFYIDLDRFKQVNDTLGHLVGDELLIQVAQRLRANIRQCDAVARLGGDEFAIIEHSHTLPKDAIVLAERILRTLAAPFELTAGTVNIGTSIGIAVAPKDSEDANEILRNADLALYQSKQQGRGMYSFFASTMDTQARQRRELEEDLRLALEAKQFEVNYQPIFALPDLSVQSFEALIRWRHPVRGWVSPAEFIPIAEETGLIIKIGEWIVREVCTHATLLPRRIKLGVNVSPAQFRDTEFLKNMKYAIDVTGIEGRRLIVEVTEGIMVKETEKTIATIAALRDMGIDVAMDDFGTGYSSLSYLQRLNFDKVKIDRSFVANIDKDPSAKAIVKAIIALAEALNLTTVAEGVETQEQLDVLTEIGCREAQGYLLGRPMPADETFKVLALSPLNTAASVFVPHISKKLASSLAS